MTTSEPSGEDYDAFCDSLPWADQPVFKSVDCGPGWWGIIRRLDAGLKEIAPDYQVMQVKEKFGGLRYYVTGIPRDVWEKASELDRAAEAESFETCEECGRPASTSSGRGYWIRTLCDEDRAAYEARRLGTTDG